jgi:hypothetical protein
MSDTDRCCCAGWEGRHTSFIPSFPDDVFETIERVEAPLDFHGCIPHSGRVRCRTCGQSYRYDNALGGAHFVRDP